MRKNFIFIICCLFFVFNLSVYGVNFYPNELSSESVFVVSKGSDVPVIEKNINQRRSPASLTKIMTYIIACENIKDMKNTKVRVRQDVIDKVDPESSGCKLKEGEELTPIELMHCMMICSSGYAAMVLADYVGNGVDNFVNMMNSKAMELGCKDTFFANPDGFYDEKQYSTAEDIYKITRYAMNLPEFLTIVGKSEYSIFNDSRNPIVTTNKMIDRKRGGEYYLPCVKGIKTGSLNEAGKCLVSYAEKNGETYIAVVMGGPLMDENGRRIEKNMAMIDTKNIYLWIFENLSSVKLFPKETPLKEIKLDFAWNHDKLLVSPQYDFCFSLPKGASKNDVYAKFNVPDCVSAPVETGDVVGSAEVFYKNEKIGEFNLVSNQTFKRNFLLVIKRFIQNIFLSPFSIIVGSLIFLFLLFYILAFLKGNNRRKKKRRRNNVRIMKNSKYRKKY